MSNKEKKEKQFLEVRGGSEQGWILGGLGDGSTLKLGAASYLCPQVWDQNRKLKSIDLTALDKHGSVYDDGEGLGHVESEGTG